jgi:hypothetical protein
MQNGKDIEVGVHQKALLLPGQVGENGYVDGYQGKSNR